MTGQSDTLVSPGRMDTVPMHSDPAITIAELLRLNKELTKRFHLKWPLLSGEGLIKDNFLNNILETHKKMRGNKMFLDKESSIFFTKGTIIFWNTDKHISDSLTGTLTHSGVHERAKAG